MGRQPLGQRWLRRIARLTGLEVVHGSANGGYVHDFTTADHRHGRIDIKTGKWEFYEPAMHFTSCERFDADPN